MDKNTINPWQWQDHFGFVQAIEASGIQRILFCAGQASVDSNGCPVHPGNMVAQIAQALDNVEIILNQAGLTFSDVVQLKYYTTDIPAFSKAALKLTERLRTVKCNPCSTLLGVTALFHPDIMVEIEATAVS